MIARAFLAEARKEFHAALKQTVLQISSNGIPTNADSHSVPSVNIAKGILDKLGAEIGGTRLSGQMAGNKFEEICKEYLEEIFPKLMHLRPGNWEVCKGIAGGRMGIAQLDQYEHLAALEAASRANPELAAALGSDYLIKPDIVIIRYPENEENINSNELLVDTSLARLTGLRKINNGKPLLHASISCKWTIRSDRAQNARSEALNLIRNRKGRLPHIAVVTGEPTPNRIASIALGTGDIDCVYHIALAELLNTVRELGYLDSLEMLQTMIVGKRLRDIADLPLDLII